MMFALEGIFRSILLLICYPIYKLIPLFYELFELIGTAEIVSSEVLQVLYNRIGTILGVYMTFRIIFSFIQMLINPDYVSDKEKGAGKLLAKAIITILLLAITPFLFDKAMEIQNFIVGVEGEGNIIANIILPDQNRNNYENFGSELSAYIFTMFYQFADEAPAEARASCPLAYDDWGTLRRAIVIGEGNVKSAKLCLGNSYGDPDNPENQEYVISWTMNGMFAVIVGGVICYTLITYTIMVGVRVIQLVFLRMAAPMAILANMSPNKDNMFSKWLKMCISTYIDLFIRMAIIYFGVFLITMIMGSDSGVALVKEYDKMWLVNVVIIIALLIFMKKAPELLKELLPSSGGAGSLGFGLKSPKNFLGGMLMGGLLTKGYDKVAGFAKTMPSRAYGAGAVGFNAWQKNTRKALGNAITAKKDDRKEMWGKAAGAFLFGGYGGMRRGLTTTNKAGRKQASDNAYAAYQSRQKMRSLGYGAGVTDFLKKDPITGKNKGWEGLKAQGFDKLRGFGMQDQYIEDLASMKDLTIESKQRRLAQMQESYGGKVTIYESLSKKGQYIIDDGFGNITTGDATYANSFDGGIPFTIAELKGEIGKATADSKKLHQKAEEQKQDKK